MQIDLHIMNKLAPEAYSVANLPLHTIFSALTHKIYDPQVLWNAIHDEEAFGSDYFIMVIEEQYSGRFTQSYDQLYNQVEKIKTEATYQIEKISDISCDEITVLKRMINEKDL